MSKTVTAAVSSRAPRAGSDMRVAPPGATVLPTNPSFAGHQTFALRSGWLKKGLDALQSPVTGGSRTFAREDALVTLGVGKNMVQSIRHWLVASRMARTAPGDDGGRHLAPTELGGALFGGPAGGGWDPFLEDAATLWLLHWQLAGCGSVAFTWAFTFNVLREYEFRRDALVSDLARAAAAYTVKPPAEETLARDVECLLHCYIRGSGATIDDNLECPLASLGLIRTAFEGSYRFDIGRKAQLPTEVFAYALMEYWVARHGAATTLSVYDIAYGEGSPGTVFKLDEDCALEYLDMLLATTGGALRFEDTPLARQVVRETGRPLQPMSILSRYYGAG